MLIAICGIDGSGKTTQIKRLEKKLIQNHNTYLTKQPTAWYRQDERLRSLLNQEIEETELLLRELALFAASDRLRHIQQEIIPKLNQGYYVLSDRYVFSTYTYFLARGINDINWLKEINKFALKPAMTFYIDVPAEIALERVIARDGQSTKREETNLERMKKVRSYFLQQPWGEEENYYILNGLESPEVIEEEILKRVNEARMLINI